MLERGLETILVIIAWLLGIGCVIAVGVMIAYWRYHRQMKAQAHLVWR